MVKVPTFRFHPAVQDWFAETFPAPTRAQALGWPEIQAGASTLVLAPTGSGKTLAAFLAAIDRLMFAPVPPKLERCRVLYVSPLRALAVDVERNLRAPARGHRAHRRPARRRPSTCPTSASAPATRPPPSARACCAIRPDILITTPESLFLLLTSQRARHPGVGRDRDRGRDPRARAGTKRGAHLALSLERLQELDVASAPAHRPLGHAASARGGRALPGRRRGPARVEAAAGRASWTRARARRSTSGSRCRSRTWRGSAAVIEPSDDEIPEGPAAAPAPASRSGPRSTRACWS